MSINIGETIPPPVISERAEKFIFREYLDPPKPEEVLTDLGV